MRRSARLACSLISLSLLCSCVMQRKPNWPTVGSNPPTERTKSLFTAALECNDGAADGAAVERCIALYEALLKDQPGHFQAQVNAANLYILRGTAYADSSSAKVEAFQKAMQGAELAMYTNAGFKAQVDAGRQPWEAADTLGAAEVEAMFFWVTALQYEFKEGMSLPRKIINLVWLQRALVFLDRIEAVAPEFGGGGVEVAKMICYFVLPKSRGGSKAKAEEYMRMAITKGNGYLLPRWAHAKYYLPAKGQKQAAKAELAWVAAQDLTAYRDSYPWRAHFQDDARKLLR